MPGISSRKASEEEGEEVTDVVNECADFFVLFVSHDVKLYQWSKQHPKDLLFFSVCHPSVSEVNNTGNAGGDVLVSAFMLVSPAGVNENAVCSCHSQHHRSILHFGNAFSSSATPASVTLEEDRVSLVRFLSGASSFSPASVTSVLNTVVSFTGGLVPRYVSKSESVPCRVGKAQTFEPSGSQGLHQC